MYYIIATIYYSRNTVCFRYIILNTLHEGNDDDYYYYYYYYYNK